MAWGKGYSFVGVMVLIGALVQCGKPHPGVHPGAPVILISVDTLRADHLPAYGYTHIETPAIDGLVGDSVLFQRAFAQAPLTLPSHASVMTGLLPPHHGVRENVGFRLGEEETTLAEVLRENGYETGAFISSMVLRKATGIGQGFDLYDDSFGLGLEAQARTYPERPGMESLNLARTWLAQDREKPFFSGFTSMNPIRPTPHPHLSIPVLSIPMMARLPIPIIYWASFLLF